MITCGPGLITAARHWASTDRCVVPKPLRFQPSNALRYAHLALDKFDDQSRKSFAWHPTSTCCACALTGISDVKGIGLHAAAQWRLLCAVAYLPEIEVAHESAPTPGDVAPQLGAERHLWLGASHCAPKRPTHDQCATKVQRS